MGEDRKLKVGWILVGPRSVPSARIEGYNLHNWLNANGHESHILYSPREFNARIDVMPPFLHKVDTVIFQKVYAGLVSTLMRLYKAKGMQVVYYITDLLMEMGEAIQLADKVIMSSNYMKSMIKLGFSDRIFILKDSYESPIDFYKTDYETKKLTALWFGSLAHFDYPNSLRPLIEGEGYQYITISGRNDKDKLQPNKEWKEEEIHEDIKRADVVIMPSVLDEFSKCKDENRLVQSMVIGLPCIVSPIPAYVDLFNKYTKKPFIIATNEEEWKESLRLFKDKELRESTGKWARECVKDDYHIDKIGMQLVEILKKG